MHVLRDGSFRLLKTKISVAETRHEEVTWNCSKMLELNKSGGADSSTVR